MEINRIDDINFNYLTLKATSEDMVNEENVYFKEEMLTVNRVPGLLKFSQINIDNERRYYYDISGRHSLASIVKRDGGSVRLARQVLTALDDVLGRLGIYFLDGSDLMISPETLFYNPQMDAFEFAYFPGINRDIKKDAAELLLFITNHIPLSEIESAGVLYELMDDLLCEGTRISDLLRKLRHNQENAQHLEAEETLDIEEFVDDELVQFAKDEESVVARKSAFKEKLKKFSFAEFFTDEVSAQESEKEPAVLELV